MKNYISGMIAAVFGLYLAFGCAYNSREKAPDPGQTVTCDTSVKYTYASVETIFTNRDCISCHAAGQNLPTMEDSTTFRNYIRSNKEKFVKAINYEGAHPMPKGAGKMPATEIKTIEAWICQGLK